MMRGKVVCLILFGILVLICAVPFFFRGKKYQYDPERPTAIVFEKMDDEQPIIEFSLNEYSYADTHEVISAALDFGYAVSVEVKKETYTWHQFVPVGRGACYFIPHTDVRKKKIVVLKR